MLNNSNKLGAPIWNSNSRTKFEFKSRKKKKKTEKGNEEEGLAAQATRLRGPASPTGLPTLPVFPNSRAAHELAQHVAHARAPVCLARSHCPLDPACQPPPSTVSSSSPTPQPPTRPAPDSCGRGRPGGHARGMTLSPCAAPTQPRTTV